MVEFLDAMCEATDTSPSSVGMLGQGENKKHLQGLLEMYLSC